MSEGPPWSVWALVFLQAAEVAAALVNRGFGAIPDLVFDAIICWLILSRRRAGWQVSMLAVLAAPVVTVLLLLGGNRQPLHWNWLVVAAWWLPTLFLLMTRSLREWVGIAAVTTDFRQGRDEVE